MGKRYFSLKKMTRALFFYNIGASEQTFKDGEGWSFLPAPRPHHGFLYVACDKVEIKYTDGKTVYFKKGNFIYIPKNLYYSITFYGVEKNRYSDLQVVFELRDIDGNEYYLADEAICILDETPDKVIRNMLSIADSTLNLLYPSFPIRREFFAMLDTVSNRLWLPEITAEKSSKVFPAICYLDKHLRDNLSVTALAKMCMLNETTFRREFKAATGKSPVQYKTEIRIKKAKELIRYTPEIPTSALVEQLGFYDASYFYKAFYKTTGETLREYRDKYK